MRRWLAPKYFSLGSTLMLAITIGLALLGLLAIASAQTTTLIGQWSLVWEGARDNYTGTLDVTSKINDRVFSGKLHLIKSNGDRITEDASITVAASEVRIECSNPSVQKWDPDRFYLTRTGDRMEGYSLDTGGQRGRKIVLTKR